MPPKQGYLGRSCVPSDSATCGARMSQTTLLSKAARTTGNPSSSVPPSDVSTNFNCTLGTLAQCVAQASKRPLAARMGTKIRGKDFKRSSRSPPPIQISSLSTIPRVFPLHRRHRCLLRPRGPRPGTNRRGALWADGHDVRPPESRVEHGVQPRPFSEVAERIVEVTLDRSQ